MPIKREELDRLRELKEKVERIEMNIGTSCEAKVVRGERASYLDNCWVIFSQNPGKEEVLRKKARIKQSELAKEGR